MVSWKFACSIVVLTALEPMGFSQFVPKRVPPKRSSQIQDGFGINSNLPRGPYLPWDGWWWTRMFDAGVSWIRIGQYENSSEFTSWDWVEQKRGVFAIAPEVDDYVDSLVENGVKVQVQLQYGNPMYTGRSGHKPDEITPAPSGFHNDDRSINSVFWPPKTADEIAAFVRYVKWMVRHFKGRVHYWALWNEPDIGYWNPWGNAEEYGRLLAAFAPAVHEADATAKVIYGGQADPASDWAKRALDECKCAAQIDVFAYHTYPGYGKNVNPEMMDAGAYGADSPVKLRTLVKDYTGIRRDIEFWDDEFNSIGTWTGSDDSVQAKYIPRGLVYNLAAGVKTFVWILTPGVDGNEFDDFGMLHGMRGLPDDFAPRPVFGALENTNALFSDTHLETAIRIETPEWRAVDKTPLLTYAFRNRNGKAILAYWLAAHSEPGGAYPEHTVKLLVRNSGIRNPVLIDVDSGEIRALQWGDNGAESLEALPLKDSVMAIADASYFDWAMIPETPSGLRATVAAGQVELAWEMHGGGATGFVLERREDDGGLWVRIAKGPAGTTQYVDHAAADRGVTAYRVRATNDAGDSAYSNVVRLRK